MKRIGTVDERYQSFNIEMVEVTGGRFWAPYKSGKADAATPAPKPGTPVGMDPSLYEYRAPIDLGNARLETGDYLGAAQVVEEALGICLGLGDRRGEAWALIYLGRLGRLTGDGDRGERGVHRGCDRHVIGGAKRIGELLLERQTEVGQADRWRRQRRLRRGAVRPPSAEVILDDR